MDDQTFDAADLGFDVQALLADPTMWDAAPPELEDRVVAAIASESPADAPALHGAGRLVRWQLPLLGAVAALGLVVGGIVVASALTADDTTVVALELTPTGASTAHGGRADLSETSSGVRIDLDAPELVRPPGGGYFVGWVETTGGKRMTAGSFHDGADVVLWAGCDLDEVESFNVSLEPADESDGEVVLQASMP